MATVNFILKHPNGKVATPVVMVFAFGRKHIKIQMGTKVLPKAWNQAKARLRTTRNNDDPEITNFNNRLESTKKSILACYNAHLSKNEALYVDRLKNEFRAILRPKGEVSQDDLTFIQGIELMIKTLDPKKWTTKHYVTTKNALIRYEKTLQKPLSFEDINMDFYVDFIHWCETVPYDKKTGALYSLNSIGSHIKEIKVFMNYANDKHWTKNKEHRHKKFKVLEETADSIYLDVDKIYKIYDVDLSKRKRLDRIRDLYCIALCTGVRYGDLHQIGPDKFLPGGKKIKIRTFKGNKTVVIPLHTMVKDIVAKYDGKLPKVPTDQEFNRCLKVIGRLAGLQERISKTTTRGGWKVSETYFEWELITVHCARRSFASNAILAGMDKRIIMLLTSHSTEKSFNKYVKLTPEQNADLVVDHPFFQGRTSMKVVS